MYGEDVVIRYADGTPVTVPSYEEPELGDDENDELDNAAPQAEAASDTAGDDVNKILARYKTPEQLAKAILEKDRFISKQGNEIGSLRKNGKSAQPADKENVGDSAEPAQHDRVIAEDSDWLTQDELRELYPEQYQDDEQPGEEPGIPPAPDDETPTPEAAVQPDADDAFDFEPQDPSIFFDEERDPVDDDTGWPLDSDGDPYKPANVYGVLYTPECRWKMRAIELSEQYPENQAYAAHLLAQERQAEESRVYQESMRHLEIRSRQQQKEVLPYVEQIAAKLTNRYPEPVAKGLATYYQKAAENFIREQVKAGQIHPMRLMSKSLLKEVTRGAYTGALESDSLDADAEMIREHLEKRGIVIPDKPGKAAPITRDTSRGGANGVKPSTNGRAISGRPTDAPVTRGTGPAGVAATRNGRVAAAQPSGDLPDEVRSQVRSGFISEEQAQKFAKAGKSFTFED